MPENPNLDPDMGSEGYYNANVTMATNNNNNRKQGVPRVSSANNTQYYDIATQLLGKAGSDLEELFIAAARDGLYEKIENFLHRNRSDYVVSIDVKDKKTGNTPLIWAAKRGHAKIVQLLLKHGADITLRNYEGQTAVEVASPTIKSILLESVERSTEASHQLLLQAAWQGDNKVVARLLSQKKVLDINCQNADGYTPILLATRDMHLFEKIASQMSRDYNPVDVVSMLLSARADLHASDGDGKTCLHHASQSKAQIAQTVVSTVISGEPNLEQKDKRCFAPLHCASLTGNADCLSALLDGGSEVNSRGFAGATALHITSYNNHEKATSVLLEHGANVTLTDDRGLTPLDFAKTRKMKKRLQEAWAEVVNTKPAPNLGPIRAHSKEDLRTSVEDLTKRKKGEVIFEGLPSNPFSDSGKKDSIAHPRGVTRHLSLKEKSSRLEEEHSTLHLRDNVRKLGQVRNQQKPSPLPRTKSRSTERLPIISPDRMGSDRNLESPVQFGRNSRARRSFEDRKQGRGRRVAPLSTREGSNLTDDVFDRLTPGPPSPTPSVHRRSESDPFRSNPNLLDIAASCEPYLQGGKRGRSYSVNSNPANDLEANRFTPHQREVTVTSLQRDITLMSVCSNRTESRLSTNSTSPRILNLGQMLSKSKTPVQHMYGPGSSKVIPPTPTFITQRCDSKSEMDVSPRSDDDVESRPELLRSKSIFKDEFVLEESRLKDPLLHSSSSASDTVSSTGSSHTSPSPRDSPLPNKAKLVGNAKTGKGRVNKTNTGLGNNAKQMKDKDSKQDLKVTGFNSREDSNVSNNVPKTKGGNASVSGNSKYVSALHNMAVRNLAAQNATKQTNNATGGAKGGGKIVMHGNGIEAVNDNVNKKESGENDTKDSNGNIVEKDTKSVSKETQGVENKGNDNSDTQNNATNKTSGNDKTTVNKTIGQPAVSSRKKAAQKQMQNVLQVVPTKLTENIVRTAPKGKTVEDKKKNVSNKGNENVCKTPKPESVSNVNIQLSPSAQVQSRVAGSEKAKTPTVGAVQRGNSDIKDTDSVKGNKSQTQTTKTNDNSTVVMKSKSTLSGSNVSMSNQSTLQTKGVINQVKSAQVTNREGAQSRNTTFNSSKSASVNQRQMGNVRKTTTGYTPRFQPNLSSKISNLGTKTDSKTVSEFNGSTAEKNAAKNAADSNNKANEDTKKTDISAAVKAAKSSSPTELVTPSVSRTSSMSKSYNMGGPQPLAKSSSSGSVTSETSTTVTKSTVTDKSDKNLKKHSVLSKSVSEPLSSTKVSSSNLMSKSIAQMPSVGTVSSDKKQNNGLPRSSSMSTFEEKNEKKLMSSSDTKIQCTKDTTKDRPMSDGPAGVASAKDNKNPPLVEILPEGAPRISKRSYMDVNNPITTPVIVNPFEELEQKRALTATDIGFVVEKPSVERSKTQTSIKSKNSKSARKAPNSAKPSSASTRGTSGRSKKSVKTKDSNKSDNEGSRPKTGKRVKSGKRKRKIPENLSKQNEKPDVALIGGIGWQIATSCIDKSEADAVIVSQIDSSESDGEDISVISHLRIPSPDSNMQLLGNLDTPSSLYSPRFKEVRQTNGEARDEDLAYMENDGYRPMNLDMTQGSLSQQNRAGVIITQDMPGDIGDFLSKLKEDDSAMIKDVNDEYMYDDDYFDNDMYDDEDIENLLHKGVIMGQLTPIPESPSITHTPSSIQHVAKTVEAISKFDKNITENDLSKLLDSTPRDKTKGNKSTPRNSGGSVRTQKDVRQSLPNSGVTRSAQSRNSSSKTSGSRVSGLSAEIKERANRVFGNYHYQSQPGSATSVMESSSLKNSSDRNNSSNSLRKHSSKEKLNTNSGKDGSSENLDNNVNSLSLKQGDANSETKERIDSKVSDLKKLLSEKMQTTQKMLEESADRKRKQSIDKYDDNSDPNDLRINLKGLTIENVKALETARLDEDAKSTRSSRKERRFSETKKTDEDDEETKEAINEILSTTVPSTKSNMKSYDSYKSRGSSTLTEADASVFKQMIQQNQNSPFHAKEPSVRISSSYDDSVTLNKDNPELMKRFHANNFQMGQKVKAMIDAGADTSRVKAMVKADNEAKQLAKIMNSFRQMELYAGPHSNNRSSKKETPRRDGENVVQSMSKFDHHHNSHHSGMPPRPGSAGAGRAKPGKFTEIKGKSASHVTPRSRSPVDVPKDLADEFKRSPFKQVSTNQEENIDELANVIRITSQDSEEDHLSLDNDDDEMERADSACTTLSSHSSIMEETIQWKKGNVLGKGAFGTVWCGLTSEGQLIAVKQIELNTTNQSKAKKEYEKVQEEVELLKTLEHKNIVGYMGTSLEDSIVSIFMQFVPGGSIASILARFGALDEAVFRKYTRQILEGVVYLHQNDVIHRDIKGGNVMLMPNGVIKLIDFGCAKRLCINLSMGQSQILKSMKGTPYWMAPEVVNETGHGKKSDIWSVGCTVFEMATRKPPWAEMNPMAAIFAIGSDKPVPELPEKFSEDAREFVNACLTKDQNKRLSASELLQCPFLKRRSKKNSSTC
ncbi:hypothetical protein ACF0H5_015620 [Mactra antiquata]